MQTSKLLSWSRPRDRCADLSSLAASLCEELEPGLVATARSKTAVSAHSGPSAARKAAFTETDNTPNDVFNRQTIACNFTNRISQDRFSLAFTQFEQETLVPTEVTLCMETKHQICKRSRVQL